MIDIVYHASLKRNTPNAKGIRSKRIEYKEGLKVKQIIEYLDLDEVGLIIVNGRLAWESAEVSDGDNIEFHPFMGGG